MKITGPENPNTRALVRVLKQNKAPLWQRIANDLAASKRSRTVLNVDQLDKLTKTGETVIVPGKILGTGVFSQDKKITIAAFSFSTSARAKLETSGIKLLRIEELEETNPKGTGIRILKGVATR